MRSNVVMKKYIQLISILLILSGCNLKYPTKPIATNELNIPASPCRDKIAGSWAVYIDKNTTVFNTEVEVDDWANMNKIFIPFDSADTISTSVEKTMSNIFEKIFIYEAKPSFKIVKENKVDGVIVVRLDEFSPIISCEMGLRCLIAIFINLGVEVQSQDEVLYAASVGVVRGNNKIQRLADAVRSAYIKTLGASMEKMASKICNSHEVRNYSISLK